MWNAAPAAGQSFEDSTVLLSDAKIAEVERVRTRLVDVCFGGGIARKSVCLFGGDPGAGKTTLCLQLSDIFCGIFGKETLYIANEQGEDEINDTAKRLHLRHRNKIRIVKAMGGITHDIGALLLHYKPCFTVLDSVTKWAGEDMNLAVIIAQRLKDYTVRLNSPTIIINQVTKGGDHAGLKKLQHAVDSTMMFEVWGENPEDPRRLHVDKNRHGPAPVSQYYGMTERGLVEMSEEEALEKLEANEGEDDENE